MTPDEDLRKVYQISRDVDIRSENTSSTLGFSLPLTKITLQFSWRVKTDEYTLISGSSSSHRRLSSTNVSPIPLFQDTIDLNVDQLYRSKLSRRITKRRVRSWPLDSAMRRDLINFAMETAKEALNSNMPSDHDHLCLDFSVFEKKEIFVEPSCSDLEEIETTAHDDDDADEVSHTPADDDDDDDHELNTNSDALETSNGDEVRVSSFEQRDDCESDGASDGSETSDTESEGYEPDEMIRAGDDYSIESLGRNKTADYDCVICMDNYSSGIEVSYMPCLHYFHEDCINEWLNMSHNCPIRDADYEE